MSKFKLALTMLILVAVTSCSSNYTYYKSKCACNDLKNFADIRRA